MQDTLGAMFVRSGERYAERPAVKAANGQRTYAEVLKNAARVANVLRAHGLQPGDRVAIMFENRVEAVETLVGITIGGFVIVPVNGQFKAAEVDHLLKNSGAQALIHTDGVREAQDVNTFANQVAATLGTNRIFLAGPITLTGAERATLLPRASEDWYNRQLLVLAKEAKVAYALVWQTYYDVTATDRYAYYYVPYPGHPEAAGFQRFYADPATCFLRDGCGR